MSCSPVLLHQFLGLVQLILADEHGPAIILINDNWVWDVHRDGKFKPGIGDEEKVLEASNEGRLIVQRLINVNSLHGTCWLNESHRLAEDSCDATSFGAWKFLVNKKRNPTHPRMAAQTIKCFWTDTGQQFPTNLRDKQRQNTDKISSLIFLDFFSLQIITSVRAEWRYWARRQALQNSGKRTIWIFCDR